LEKFQSFACASWNDFHFQLPMFFTVIVDQLLFFRGRYFHIFMIFFIFLTRFFLLSLQSTFSKRKQLTSIHQKHENRVFKKYFSS